MGVEHDAEFVQRLHSDPRRAHRQRGARARIAHPLRDLPRDAGTSLKVEDLPATTAATLDDPEPLSMERMPGILDGRQLRSV